VTRFAYPGLRHELFNEPSHAAILGDLVAWLEPRLER
jgi:alpha-beta hydrolase superfamily lysophospholipase